MPRQSKPHLCGDGRWWRCRINGKTHWLGKHTGPLPRDPKRAHPPAAVLAKFHQLMGAKLAPEPSGRPMTVAGAVGQWLTLHAREAYPRWLRQFVAFAGGVYLEDIGRDFLTRYHVHLKRHTYCRKGRLIDRDSGERKVLAPRKLGDETIRHWMRVAAAVLQWAHDQGWLPVLPTLPRLSAPIRRDRDVAGDTLAATLDDLPERAGRILRFIAATGCRPSEACRLTWRDVHLDRGVCILSGHKTGAKTGAPRTIYLTRDAADVLRSMRPSVGPVFCSRFAKRYTSGGLRAILRRHGAISPYQLRHSFAQNASESGVPAEVLAKLLGHATTRTTAFYYSVRDQRALTAAQSLSPIKLEPKGETA